MGLVLFLFKALILGFPLIPEKKTYLWNIETHITFHAKDEPVKVSLFIPRNTRHFSIVNENFISRGYGLATRIIKGNRRAVWSIRNAKAKQSLYYSASVRRVVRGERTTAATPPLIEMPKFEGARLEAATSIITQIRQQSADVDSMVTELIKSLNRIQPDDNVTLLLGKDPDIAKKVHLAVDLLSQAGIPARAVHGIKLESFRRDMPLLHWIEVFMENEWRSYDPLTVNEGMPDDYLPWWKGKGSLVQLKGGDELHATLSIDLNMEEAVRSAIERSRVKNPFLLDFSLFSLPIKTQAVYHVLLLVPVGAFLLVILRNVVGLKTFGTFMPVLIALAFRETELLSGLILFSIIIALGLSIRLYLEHLKLLVVPRLASVLIIVVVLMAVMSVLTHKLGIERGLSVALFPMVIITMTIERMSIIWEESGAVETLKQGIGSMMAASIAYLVMSMKYIEHVIYVFPELLLLLLAGTILLGRYTGYRLLELRRFRDLTLN
jgi:hypothetical protein